MTIKRIIPLVLLSGVMFAGIHSEVYAKAADAKVETAAPAAKVSLNKADAKTLMQVKGMNAYKAHAIVAYRKKNGDFKTLEDLMKVKGFKRMKPEAMKAFTDQLSIE